MTLPDDATIRSIKINPVSEMACGVIAYGCGCRTTGHGWELCLYHEGFDIGVYTVRGEAGQMTTTAEPDLGTVVLDGFGVTWVCTKDEEKHARWTSAECDDEFSWEELQDWGPIIEVGTTAEVEPHPLTLEALGQRWCSCRPTTEGTWRLCTHHLAFNAGVMRARSVLATSFEQVKEHLSASEWFADADKREQVMPVVFDALATLVRASMVGGEKKTRAPEPLTEDLTVAVACPWCEWVETFDVSWARTGDADTQLHYRWPEGRDERQPSSHACSGQQGWAL